MGDPVFPPCCVENVENDGGKLCSWEYCKNVQDRSDEYCKNFPNNGECHPLPGIEDGKDCWCCCSCFAYNTPIEASPGEFVFVQDVVQDVDSVLAGSLSGGVLTWEERVVDYSAGIGPSGDGPPLRFDNLFYLSYQSDQAGSSPQFIVATVDHLFLMPNGKVRPIQYLAPGDQIMSAHGGLSTVRFVIVAAYEGGLHHLFFDGFNNQTLDGHLLSANGVVSADYSVQLRYSNGELNPALIDLPSDGTIPLRAGSVEYNSRNLQSEAANFMSDPSQWPAGLTPRQFESMINVPPEAASYFTQAQAEDIAGNIPPLNRDNAVNVDVAQWVFHLYSRRYAENITFLIDWDNDLPNGYTWQTIGQRILLLTGGLLRIPGFGRDGFSFVVSHLIAASQGVKCVGPADYDSVFLYMRLAWNGNLFFTSYHSGLDQVQRLFGAVEPDHAAPNSNDICREPGLKCRLAIYDAAGSLQPMPVCGDPNEYFGVLSAGSGRARRYVAIQFNRPLNVETAETIENYTINDGQVQIREARVCGEHKNTVRLRVEKLERKTEYTVVVQNVLSENDQLISPEHDRATFTTE